MLESKVSIYLEIEQFFCVSMRTKATGQTPRGDPVVMLFGDLVEALGIGGPYPAQVFSGIGALGRSTP